ncbi:MAG TPA: LytTR family DNA-binding domain-containing protein [Gemmatimonadaceae bacterium]|nr:LytTR family DNA-binding domain-containing protein [Gemmatimonadaceae bacterium]
MPDAASPLRVLVVDDEPLARDSLRVILAAEPDVELVGECADGADAVRAIRELGPDLVFLDARMPVMDGFDVVAAVGPARMPSVIFVTAYDAHAVRAFEVHALDYVLKPFDDDRLRAALARARTQLVLQRHGALTRRLAALLEGREPDERPDTTRATWLTRLQVPVGDRIRLVRVEDVDWLEGAGNYVRVHSGRERHLVRTTLASLERELDPSRFARIHRSAIVNLDRVRELEPYAGGDYIAFLADGRKLRVSRTYRDRLLDVRR